MVKRKRSKKYNLWFYSLQFTVYRSKKYFVNKQLLFYGLFVIQRQCERSTEMWKVHLHSLPVMQFDLDGIQIFLLLFFKIYSFIINYYQKGNVERKYFCGLVSSAIILKRVESKKRVHNFWRGSTFTIFFAAIYKRNAVFYWLFLILQKYDAIK